MGGITDLNKTTSRGVTPDASCRAFTVRAFDYKDINDDLIHQWAELEGRALESNAYLSPYFIIPALKHLTPRSRPIFLIVENKNIRNCLTGVGIFERSSGTKRMPVPHLRAYRSPHSYLSGLLIDSEFAEQSLTAIFSFFCNPANRCHGVKFFDMSVETKLSGYIAALALRFNFKWHEFRRMNRSVFVPEKGGNEYLDKVLTAKKRKDLRRCMNNLRSLGNVTWRAISGEKIDSRVIETALNLEHMGWKGAIGTSLLSHPGHAQFFREMAAGFSKRGRAFFTELSLNGEVIASTSNIVSGCSGFAFKVGWNPKFAKMSPGILNEIEFINNAALFFNDLEFIDSGADEGSFIDDLWSERRTLVSGIYGTTNLGKTVLWGTERIRGIKSLIQSRTGDQKNEQK